MRSTSTSRSLFRGLRKEIHVYRFFAKDTVEEILHDKHVQYLDKQKSKKQPATAPLEDEVPVNNAEADGPVPMDVVVDEEGEAAGEEDDLLADDQEVDSAY